MYRNILLPSGYNEFISICVSYISCPSLVLMSRYILADGQKENNNGFRFVFLPPLSGPAQYCSLKGDFFSARWCGTTPPSFTLPTILASLYGRRSSQADSLTDWHFPTFSAILLSISSSSPESALTRICSQCWKHFPISGRPSSLQIARWCRETS